MATTRVISNIEMSYNGIKRYKGELFDLIGALNDEKLVRVGHVRVVANASLDTRLIVRDDATGREFVDEAARIAYRRAAPSDAIVVQRKAGRPRKPRMAANNVVNV